MAQNRSTAVMQRRKVAPDALDYFPTPPFATRALCEFLDKTLGYELDKMSVREPACGEMHMAKPLLESFGMVLSSDVHQYGNHPLVDFALEYRTLEHVDWVISNPPFRLAAEFIHAGMHLARVGTAMLLRGAFLEGGDRYETLFKKMPPSYVLQFSERIVMLEGRLIERGAIDPFAEKPGTKASSATAYCWFIWLTEDKLYPADTRLRWIAPCMKRLTRPGDYPEYANMPVASLNGPAMI